MNLLTDPWIPVCCQSGQRRTISPLELAGTGDLPIALAAMRPDFNGALAQFLIGLLQWLAPGDDSEWSAIAQGQAPLELERLRELVPYFMFDEGLRRFMQDMDFESDAAESGNLAALLLDSPGDNTVKNNADLFIKRSDPVALSLPLAAQVLLTLQINAPSGGQGHRTSLRGGGPMTVLLWPNHVEGKPASLWQKLWLNTLVLSGDEPRTNIIFPWATNCITSEQDRDVRTQLDKQSPPSALELALLCYFATPRRIRLDFAEGRVCAFTNEQGRCATGFQTRNFGANYKSDRFMHPLSPYYRAKTGEWLPMHLNAIGFTYVDWVTTQDDSENARMPAVLKRSRMDVALQKKIDADAIWAFGYAMDNMKCLAWHEARYQQWWIDPGKLPAMMAEARRWVDGTECVRRALGRQLRVAWSDSGKGDTSTGERELYALTEPIFYALVQEVIAFEDMDDDALNQQQQAWRRRWHQALARAAMQLFARHAERGDVAETNLQSIERTAFAHRALGKTLQIELKDVLELDVAERTAKKHAKRKKTA